MSDPNVARGRPEAAVIRELIEIEAKAEPQYVGGEIDIVTLDATGAHWEKK